MITKIVRTLSFPIQYLFPFINSIPLHLQKNIRSKTSKRKKKEASPSTPFPIVHAHLYSTHPAGGGGRGNNPIIVPRCHLPSSPLLVPITQPWQLPLSKGRGGTETEGEREEKRFPLIQDPYHPLPSTQGKFQKPRAERRWNGGGKMGWKLCVFIVVE